MAEITVGAVGYASKVTLVDWALCGDGDDECMQVTYPAWDTVLQEGSQLLVYPWTT